MLDPRHTLISADQALRWLVAPSFVAFFGWNLYFMSRQWPFPRAMLAGLVTLLLLAWLFDGFHQGKSTFLLLAGLGGLAPLIRLGLGGSAAFSELLSAYGPAVAWVDLVLRLLVAAIVAPVSFHLYRHRASSDRET